MNIENLEKNNIFDDTNKKDKKTKKPKTDKKNTKSKKTNESKNESNDESKKDKEKVKKDKKDSKNKKSKKKNSTEVKNTDIKKTESLLKESSNVNIDAPTYNENVSVITEIMGPDYDLSETIENVISTTSSESLSSKIENNKVVNNIDTPHLKNNINLSTIDSDIMNFEDNENIYKRLNDKKISQPYLTKYEKAKIIGISAQQIESGREALVSNIPNSFTNPLQIAEYELYQKKTPIIIKRKLPNDESEYWTLEQLTIL